MPYKTIRVFVPDTDPKAEYFLWQLDGRVPQVLRVCGATLTEKNGVYELNFTYRGEPLCVSATVQEAHDCPGPTAGRLADTARRWIDSDFRLNGGFS